MDAADRRDLFERANRQSATNGRELPETGDENIGIDRARNALKSLHRERFGAAVRSATLEDRERWLEFVDAIRR